MEECIKDCKNCYVLTCDQRTEFPARNCINNEDCSDSDKIKQSKAVLLNE